MAKKCKRQRRVGVDTVSCLEIELARAKRERAEAESLVRQAFEDARRGMASRGGLTAEGEKWFKASMKVIRRADDRRKRKGGA